MNWLERERRQFVRVRFPCQITIYLPVEKTISTHTENISCGGARVIIREDIPVSSIVGIKVFIGKTTLVNCKGKVVWRVKVNNPLEVEGDLFDTGLEFVGIEEKDREKLKTTIELLLQSYEKC